MKKITKLIDEVNYIKNKTSFDLNKLISLKVINSITRESQLTNEEENILEKAAELIFNEYNN